MAMEGNKSYLEFESILARVERRNKRLFIITLIMLVSLVASNAGWIIHFLG